MITTNSVVTSNTQSFIQGSTDAKVAVKKRLSVSVKNVRSGDVPSNKPKQLFSAMQNILSFLGKQPGKSQVDKRFKGALKQLERAAVKEDKLAGTLSGLLKAKAGAASLVSSGAETSNGSGVQSELKDSVKHLEQAITRVNAGLAKAQNKQVLVFDKLQELHKLQNPNDYTPDAIAERANLYVMDDAAPKSLRVAAKRVS